MHRTTWQGNEQWFYARGGEVFGPVTMENLRTLAARGDLRANDYLWCEGMTDWIVGREVVGVFDPPRTPPKPPPVGEMTASQRSDVLARKVAAGVCGIVLGAFGVHKFILGYTRTGLMMLLVTILTCFLAFPVMHVIGIIEGVLYLVKTEDQFYRDYVAGRRNWF